MTPREPGAFTVPGFARLWWSATISGFGSPMTMLAAQTLVLIGLHGSALDAGLVAAARWVPYLLLGPVAGALVDRRPRVPVVVGADLGRFAVLAGVPLLWWAGLLSIPVLAGVMALVGLLSLFGDAAYQSVIPRLVPRDRLQPAHARLDQSDAVAQVSGPAVAGALIGVAGAAAAVAVDAVTFLVSAVLLRRLPVVEPPASRAPLRGLWGEMGEGLRWVYRQRRLGSLALLTHGWFVCNAMLGPVFTAFVLLRLHASPFWLGVTLSAAGLASLLGATVTTAVGRRLDAGRTIILAHAITTVGMTVLLVTAVLHPGLPVAIALLCLGQAGHGFAMGLSNSHEMGYRQLVTPDALQARANITMRAVNRSMIIAGAPLGGLLADRAGSAVALAVVTAGFALVTLAMWCSPVRKARYSDAGA